VRKLLLLVLTLSVAAAGSSAALARRTDDQPVVPPDAIALVAGEPLPKADFDRNLARAKRSYAQTKRSFPKPGTAAYWRLRDQLVRFLVQRVEFRQKAAQMGIAVTDAQVDARIADLKKRYFGGSDKKFNTQLRKSGLTMADLREDIRAQLLNEAIFEAVTAQAAVTDDEIAAYYQGHRKDFRKSASRLVQHVMVRTRAKADWIYGRLRAGASFDALARKYSLDPGSRSQGGRLTISRGQTVQPFDRVAFSLKTGQISHPVKTQFGWHLIKALSAIRPAKTVPLATVRESIQKLLLQQKKNASMEKWTADLKAEYADKVVYQAGFAPGSP
jgi:foldase protein PrsA